MGKKDQGADLGWNFIMTGKDLFRIEFYNAIIGSPYYETLVHSSLEGSLVHKLRYRASRIAMLRFVYKIVRKLVKLLVFRFKRIKEPSPDNLKSSTHKDFVRRPEFYLVVPFFLEMNGPESHYGELITLAKSLGFEVNYVATEGYDLKSHNSSFDSFEGVRILHPNELGLLTPSGSVFVNCGSPWIYRNLEWITSAGGIVIDFLFNHVGHTRMNLLKGNLLFSTVCQHRKLYEILSETSEQNDAFNYIPIPFPRPNIKILEYEDKSAQPLWVGRLSAEKGVERLVEIAYAFNRLSGKSIRVIGNGPLKATLRQAVLAGVIEWSGDLSLRETLGEINKHKVLINTSKIEGLSLVAMEALSLQSKFVGLDVGGMDELKWNSNAFILPRDTNAISFAQCIISAAQEPNYVNVPIPNEYTKEFRDHKWKELLEKATLFAS